MIRFPVALLVVGDGVMVVAAWAVDAVGVGDSLLQYGAIGLLALLALFAVRALFQRQVQAHERDIARADKAEAQLLALNELIRTDLVVQLTRATDAASRALDMLAEQRSRRDERGN